MSSSGTFSGVQPRSFRLIAVAQRAGCAPWVDAGIDHRRLEQPQLVVIVEMVKFWLKLSTPSALAWMRRMRAARLWKVPSHQPVVGWPISASTRSRISPAALLVNVTASSSCGRAVSVISRCPIRVVRARVLPVPAPASTSTGPARVSTASRWGGFSPCRCQAGRAAGAFGAADAFGAAGVAGAGTPSCIRGLDKSSDMGRM